MEFQEKEDEALNFFEQVRLPLSSMIDLEMNDFGNVKIFDQPKSESLKVFEIANSKTQLHGFEYLSLGEHNRIENLRNGYALELKLQLTFEQKQEIQMEESLSDQNNKNQNSLAKKQVLRNFLPTLKRCIIRCLESQLNEIKDDKHFDQFIQPKKIVTIDLINKIFAKDFLFRVFSKMFRERKLKRQFQISRVLPRNRKYFHQQRAKIKKSFIVGKLSCL